MGGGFGALATHLLFGEVHELPGPPQAGLQNDDCVAGSDGQSVVVRPGHCIWEAGQVDHGCLCARHGHFEAQLLLHVNARSGFLPADKTPKLQNDIKGRK